MPLALMIASAVPAPVLFKEVTFTTAAPAVRQVPVTARALAAKSTPRFNSAGLPTIGPSLPVRGSGMSPLLRARDVLDLAQTPAAAVAKLFRLDAAGKRTATACTATFIGPRYLITAGHCLVDRSRGTPHPGFEVATRYDDGESPDGAPLPVRRAWVPADQWLMSDPREALVTDERCSDYAVVELAGPRSSPSWLPLRHQPAGRLVHRFSYPHMTTRQTFANLTAGSAQERAALDEEIRRSERKEPSFRPTDLYYEYGAPDIAAPSHFADRSGQVITGQSGSALLDRDGAVIAILSRHYEGVTYSCRLQPGEIAAIKAIMAAAAPRP